MDHNDADEKATISSVRIRRIRIVVSLVGKLFVPTVVRIYYTYVHNRYSKFSDVVLPAIVAFFTNGLARSLSSVQEAVSHCDNNVPAEKSVTCDILHEPDGGGMEIRTDIIFIHGLHGSLTKTWRQGDWHVDDEEESDQKKKKQQSDCWPRDWLPSDCPGTRVISLSYTTDPYLWRPVWIKKRNRSTSMEERSDEMMEHLLRIGVGKYPIVWVGHSKGGLFIKQMLVHALERNNNLEFCYQTKAIMFYSVPHRGSSLADFNLPFVRRSVELLEIRKNCVKVLNLHDKFMSLIDDTRFRFEIFSFIETSLTLMTCLYLKIVAYESADLGIGKVCGVPLDHRQICKPVAPNCFLYHELIQLIHRNVYSSL